MADKVVNKNTLLNVILFRYLPYWPLFAALVLICCLGAWFHVHSLKPLYEATATILIKDEKDDVGGAKILESMKVGSSNKGIENEIEVLQSKSLIKEVVKKLHLYAPVFEESEINTLPAYNISPIIIKVKTPESIKGHHKIYFSFDEKDQAVKINSNTYSLNEWLETPFGTLMFAKNESQVGSTLNPLYFDLIGINDVANYYSSGLSVYVPDENSSVVAISLKDNNLQRAEDFVNSLIEVYTKVSVADKNTIAVSTLSFLEERIKLIEDELDSLERHIKGYKVRNGVVDLSTQGRAFLESVSANDQKVADINVKLAVLDQVERYVTAKGSKTGLVPSSLGVSDPLLSELLHTLYNSEVQYEALKKTGAENNPKLIALRAEIQQIRPSIVENIQNQRAGLQTSINRIYAANSSYNAVLSKIPQQEKDLLDFSRRQSIKSGVYTYLLQRREETALSLAATKPDSKVIDAAEGYMIPNGPHPATVYSLAFILGILLSIGIVAIRDHGNTNILFRSEIEDFTSVPIVGEIAKVKGKLPVAAEQPKLAFVAEQFRQLRAAIGLYGKASSKKRLMVTSSIPGEGKSFISSNLALNLALAGKKTVLIDFDIRNPKISELFEYNSSVGVADYLEGKVEVDQVVQQTNYSNLFVIPAGNSSFNPTELLLMGNLEALFEALSYKFDYILIDTSPIDPVSDAYVISQYCDLVLFVIRHSFTPKSSVQLLDESNKIKALKNLAIVFNGVKPRGFIKKNYGYGYGYGYEKVYADKMYTRRV